MLSALFADGQHGGGTWENWVRIVITGDCQCGALTASLSLRVFTLVALAQVASLETVSFRGIRLEKGKSIIISLQNQLLPSALNTACNVNRFPKSLLYCLVSSRTCQTWVLPATVLSNSHFEGAGILLKASLLLRWTGRKGMLLTGCTLRRRWNGNLPPRSAEIFAAYPRRNLFKKCINKRIVIFTPKISLSSLP